MANPVIAEYMQNTNSEPYIFALCENATVQYSTVYLIHWRRKIDLVCMFWGINNLLVCPWACMQNFEMYVESAK